MQICISCRLCAKKCYSNTQMSLHLKVIHRDQKTDWFEPTPPLEGDIQEVTANVQPSANLQEIEAVKDEPKENE